MKAYDVYNSTKCFALCCALISVTAYCADSPMFKVCFLMLYVMVSIYKQTTHVILYAMFVKKVQIHFQLHQLAHRSNILH